MAVAAITVARDLRSGTPVWLARGAPRLPVRRLERDARADVVVVGGGITGALVADALVRTGRSVLAVDRRGFVRGSTPASTALLQFEIDRPVGELIRAIGRERALRAWWRSAQAVDRLRGRIADLGLRCGFQERGSVQLPGDVLDADGLAEEAALRRAAGLRSRLIGSDELRARTGIAAPAAILSTGNAEADPVRLTAGLWRAAAAAGAVLHAPVEVAAIEPDRAGVTLATTGGPVLRARQVVLATGYETPALVPKRGLRVVSTWALATAPQPGRLWPARDLIWQAADPYLYLRTTRDGRVVVGGEDEPLTDEARRDALLPAKLAAITTKARRLLPGLDLRPAFAWAGCFGESRTGLPAIGPVPGVERCFAALGYGGNGITFSMIAAELISRAIEGVDDPDAAIFAP